MSLRTAEFLQRMAASINDSPNCDNLLPALSQIRANCLKVVSQEIGSEVAPDRNLCCRWCLNSWSLGQYTLRVLPQTRPRGFKTLRAKFASNLHESSSSVKKKHRFIGHHFLSLKCDVCLGLTKIPIPKPMKMLKEETPPLSPPVTSSKKKKKTKKKDNFVGLNPEAVKAVKQKNVTRDSSNSGQQVVNIFEVLSPSSIQNGVNIVSNRTSSKNRSQPSSASSNDKPSTLKNKVKESPDLKIPCEGKNKKKKSKSNREKPKKNTVASALASFLNSI